MRTEGRSDFTARAITNVYHLADPRQRIWRFGWWIAPQMPQLLKIARWLAARLLRRRGEIKQAYR
jgi:hypothetical protein